MRVLVTGFEPFGGERINPSAEVVRALAADPPPGCDFAAVVLPVSYARVPGALLDAVSAHRADVVIATGQAGGRPEISVERVGINVGDFRIADNDGAQVVDEKVVPDGPAAYFATVPVKAMVARLREAGVPAHLSNTAGTHLCNHVLYRLGHLGATAFPGLRGGFLHLPWLPQQAAAMRGEPSMALATQVLAARVAVATVLAVRQDTRVSEGATH